MTESEKKILEGFLSKTLKIDTEDFASLYNEAGELSSLKLASEADASRIKKLKDDNASQYSRGIKEGAAKIEKELKEKYDLDSDLIGIELVEHLINERSTTSEKIEDVAKHPDFQTKLKLETDKLLKAKDKEWEKKLSDKEAEYSRQAIMTRVKEKALAELDNLRPILPEDAKKAQKWKEKFVEELVRYEYQEADGNYVPMKEGKPLSDTHGYSKSFADHVKDTASEYFDFQAAEERSSPAHKDNSNPKPNAPRDDKEYVEQMRKAQTPQERVQIMKSYKKM